MLKIIGVIVARMSSSRLPGKCLLELGGKSNLERHFERIMCIQGIDDVYLATSKSDANQPLVEKAKKLGMKIYLGADEDVVERFVGIGRFSGATALVRVGCDKPLFDTELMAKTVSGYDGEDYVYIGGDLVAGISHEILSLSALEKVHENYRGTAIAQYVREHPHLFQIKRLMPHSVYLRPEYRLSLDTPEDYNMLAKIFDELSLMFDIIPTREVLKFLDDNPEIAMINKGVMEKNVNIYSTRLEKEPVLKIMMADDGRYYVLDRSNNPVSYPVFCNIVENQNRWSPALKVNDEENP